jgi:hypothetical protein
MYVYKKKTGFGYLGKGVERIEEEEEEHEDISPLSPYDDSIGSPYKSSTVPPPANISTTSDENMIMSDDVLVVFTIRTSSSFRMMLYCIKLL